jgi:hypothetical protein
MQEKPLGKARRRSHRNQIDHSSPLEIHEHGAVPLLLPPSPVVYTQDPHLPLLGTGPRSASPAGVSYLGWPSFPSAAADSIPAIRPERNRLAATSGSVDSFLVPAGWRRRAIAPQRSCVDSADCDSEGDESSPGPAPVAPARADRASGEHR